MAANTILNTGTGGDTIATDDLTTAKAQRVKVMLGATGTDGGNVTATNPFPIGVAGSIFTASTANSTTTQLAASATFTGTVETVYNQQTISLLVVSDQPGTLTCLQYIDAGGTKLAHTDVFTNTAGVPISRAIVANGNYFKLTYQNTGASTTTTLQVDTAYGQLVPITNLGNQPMALAEYNNAALSSTNPLPTIIPTTLVTGASANALNTDLLTGTVSGWYDASNFRSGSVQVIGLAGITAGAVTFEFTNDTTNAAAGLTMPVSEVAVLTSTTTSAAITIAASTIRIFSFPVVTRYVRCRISTAFTGANVQATSVFSASPYVPNGLTVAQATAANLNVNVTQATATNLNATVSQTTATNLNATVSQATATSLNATVSQATATNLNATVNASQWGGTAVVTGGVAGTVAVGGNIAHSSPRTANPVTAGGQVTTTLDTTLVQGDVSYLMQTSAGQLIQKPFGSSENDWTFTTSLTTTTTATAAKAAGAASIRNYVTGVQYQNASATATTVLIQDGATTIWQSQAPASMTTPANVTFQTPLKGTAATALNYNFGTAGATILINVQGYQSF